jgi:hypothetical protein
MANEGISTAQIVNHILHSAPKGNKPVSSMKITAKIYEPPVISHKLFGNTNWREKRCCLNNLQGGAVVAY